ncbi:hypothetical protein U3516DRAFT_740999 [Neocallimastix sp. 'constans']
MKISLQVPNTNGKLYKDFYYTESIPTHNQAKGRIVIFTGSNYLDVGINVEIKDMGSCREYPKDGNKCYPLIYDNYRIQDAYNLDADEKWDLVYDILTNKIAKIDDTNNKFYSLPDNTPLTFNFMNMARMDTKHNSINDIIKDIGDLFFDADIDDSAYYVNVRLAKFINEKKDSIHNNWFILDYPTKDVIRKIYQSNSENESLRKEEIKVPGSGTIFWSGSKYWITQIPIIGTAFDIFFKRSENTSKIFPCLQRKIDKSGHDIVKTDYRYVHNKLNQWYIESNNKYFNIVSVYDNKCLTYINDNLEINECDKKNINNDFIINNKAICSRVDENKCLDNIFNIMPISLESKIYENLTCSIKFAKHGYRCCSNQNTQVKYVDNLGNWGVEKGKLCGIGYTRCSWNIFGYPCCSSVNPEVRGEDEIGSYGIEDGEWCGIGEPVYDTKMRIGNKKTQECLITNLHSDTNTLLMGDCNHSKWTHQSEQLVLDATGKCLFAMNSQNARMINCNEGDNQISHHIHFKIVDNTYICIKNNVDPEDRCLNGSTLNFEPNKDEFSEWYIESWNGKIVNSIDEIVRNNPNLDFGVFKTEPPKSTTIAVPTSTSTPESTNNKQCPFQDYPCCTDQNTNVVDTDDTGDWGSENGNWCHILSDF